MNNQVDEIIAKWVVFTSTTIFTVAFAPIYVSVPLLFTLWLVFVRYEADVQKWKRAYFGSPASYKGIVNNNISDDRIASRD